VAPLQRSVASACAFPNVEHAQVDQVQRRTYEHRLEGLGILDLNRALLDKVARRGCLCHHHQGNKWFRQFLRIPRLWNCAEVLCPVRHGSTTGHHSAQARPVQRLRACDAYNSDFRCDHRQRFCTFSLVVLCLQWRSTSCEHNTVVALVAGRTAARPNSVRFKQLHSRAQLLGYNTD
jgi:hypothetical protein